MQAVQNGKAILEMDREMEKLHHREKELLHLLEVTSNQEEKESIGSHLSKLRKHFYELKNEYVRLKNNG